MRTHRLLVLLLLLLLTACAPDPPLAPARWCGIDSTAVPLQGDSLRYVAWLIRTKRCP